MNNTKFLPGICIHQLNIFKPTKLRTYVCMYVCICLMVVRTYVYGGNFLCYLKQCRERVQKYSMRGRVDR